MAKSLTAAESTSQALSTANYKQELETQQQPYNPLTALNRLFVDIEAEKRHRWQVQQEKEEEENRRKVDLDFYRRKRLEAHYLEIAYAILGEDTGQDLEQIDLIYDFKRQDFIDIAFKWLHFSDFQKLADKVSKLYEHFNRKFIKVKHLGETQTHNQYFDANTAFDIFLSNPQGGLTQVGEPDLIPNALYWRLDCNVGELKNLSKELNAIVKGEEREQQEQERGAGTKTVQTLEA